MGTLLVGSQSEGTTTDFATDLNTDAWGFVAVASGVADKLWINPKVANAGDSIRVGIYAAGASANVPGALLGVAGPFTMPAGTGPFSFDISALGITIVSGTRYHLAFRDATAPFDFQGTSAAASYLESLHNFQTPYDQGQSTSTGGVRLAIWVEDAGAGGPVSTGEKFPTLGETVSEAPWSDDTWVTPTNITSDNAATANVTATTFDSPDQTWVLKATGFDFSSIPDDATILGVIVRTNAWFRAGQGAGSIDLMQLLSTAKAKVGTNKASVAVALTSVNTTVITFGGAADLWGNALTPAWVKNANFGVALGILATAANADVDVDYITVEVVYQPSGAPAPPKTDKFFPFI